MTDTQIYFREENAKWSGDRLAITLLKFRVIARTPKGCWIAHLWDTEGRFKKFVLDGLGRRYAYPTRELARESFIIRKRREIQHTSAQHDRAVRYLALAETMQFGSDTKALHELRTPGELIFEHWTP